MGWFAAEPGQTWEIDVFSRYNSDDSIAGTQNHMVMKIEFLDAGGTVLMEDEVRILDANSPADGWIDHTPLPLGPAPAGTVEARPVFLFIQPAAGLFEGGAGHLDDASFRLVGGGGGAIDLGAFSLTADVRGAANAGAGETLGDYQLRLEDSGGNRLIFAETANGAFQSIGGPLSTAQETDPDGNPAVGVFDVNSSAFHVVLAFDNESGMPWGAGGTIEVDNLTFANTDPDGSAWFAGLFWNGLVLPEGGAFDTLSLTADVKGSVPGGAYELRVEAFEVTFAGLDHNFDTVTGVGGGVFLDPNGGGFGFTTDWDTGVQGEGAFGGLFGGSTIFPFSSTSGFSAQGLVGGGLSGGAGEIRVEDVILGVGGGWFAGLDFGDQGLASTDLSQVTLSANVRGLTASGGNLGDYELRIEDAQGDRLYFPMTANGAWQAVGGTLNTALEGGALGGGGDGFFDLDSPTYTVVLSFVGPETTWLFGGALQIDDLFLTPVQVNNEIGRVSFQGIANGAFQTLGGLLADGVSNFGDYDQDFSGASATGGGAYGPGNAGGWDDGLSNEDAFFGVFGNAVINAGASAQACATCGVGGSRAGQLIVNDVPPGTGGWFAGLFFTGVAADLSGDLSQIMLSADVQGATVGAGSTLGNYFIRIEDADLTVLSFTVAANGAFQSVGGALTDATLEQIDAGDGVFNFNQPAYTVTIGFVGTSSNWGPGGALIVDNLFLTGVQFEDADTYTVTVTFADEVATWGTNGTLTVDNLFLGVAPDCPGDLTGDSVIGLSDLAILLSNFGTVSGAEPEDGDLDDDGDVDIIDLAIMLSLFGT